MKKKDLLHQLEGFFAFLGHAVAGAEDFRLVEGVGLEAFDLNVAGFDHLFQGIDFCLIDGNVVGDVSLLAQAVLSEENLGNHRNDCDDDDPGKEE